MRQAQDNQQKYLEVGSSQDLHLWAKMSYEITFVHGSLSMQYWSQRDVNDKCFLGISTNTEFHFKRMGREHASTRSYRHGICPKSRHITGDHLHKLTSSKVTLSVYERNIQTV